MRITHQSIVNQVIFDMQRSLSALEEKRGQVASSRRLLRPSDDPVEVARALGFRNRLAEIRQHIRNMDNMSARLNQTDAVLRSTNNVLIRAKELALQYGTEPTLSALDRANGVEQIRQLKKQIVQLANTKVGGQFIFAGSKTRTRPYQEKGTVVFYNGNNEEISIEIEEDRTVPVNIPGSRVFETSESGIFKMFDDFQRALAENNTESGREIIGRIDTVTEVVLNGQATNAARTQRVEISLDRLSDDEIDTLEALSIAEDVDIPRAITEFLNQQNTYQAALSSTARAIQPSLLTVLG